MLALKYMNGSLQGLSVTQCSWVYGSAFVTTIVFSPIFGKYIEVIGSRKLFLYGTFLAGATNVLFGFLQWIEDQNLFLALSLSIRIVSVKVACLLLSTYLPIRDLPRFLDQVGHQTTNASIENKHFFTK